MRWRTTPVLKKPPFVIDELTLRSALVRFGSDSAAGYPFHLSVVMVSVAAMRWLPARSQRIVERCAEM